MSKQIADMQNLFDADPYAKLLGVRLCDGGPGFAVLEMIITDQHLNFLGGGHGGAIFSLADMAFGLASNSYDKISIGIDAHIAYIKGAGAGDVLVARADEVSRNRRTAVYRVDVTLAGNMIATFTGTVHITRHDHENVASTQAL